MTGKTRADGYGVASSPYPSWMYARTPWRTGCKLGFFRTSVLDGYTNNPEKNQELINLWSYFFDWISLVRYNKQERAHAFDKYHAMRPYFKQWRAFRSPKSFGGYFKRFCQEARTRRTRANRH